MEQRYIQELVEVKLSDDSLHKPLIYYAQRLNPNRATQIVFNLKRSFSKSRLDVISPIERFGDLLAPGKNR
jgi:hypothetical protein